MAIVNGLCVLYASDHTQSLSSGVSWALLNQSIYASIAFIHNFNDSSLHKMQWIRFIEA